MTKVISLSDEAYYKLAALKKSKESFSKVVLRVSERSGRLSDIFGVWKNETEMDEIFRNILRERHKMFPKEVRL